VVSLLTLSEVEYGFEPLSDKTFDYKLVVVFSAKHPALKSKHKDWLALEVERQIQMLQRLVGS
jgi:hypothetical protein